MGEYGFSFCFPQERHDENKPARHSPNPKKSIMYSRRFIIFIPSH